MANEFDLSQIRTQVLGKVGVPFPLLGLDNLRVLPNVGEIGKAVFGKSHLGVSYFMDVVIDNVRLPNEPLITISNQKRIVETVVTGSQRRGTVKEMINAQDYRLRIEGICIDLENPKTYPREQVEQIITICETNRAVSLENSLAELFGIYNIVIKRYAFDKMQGQPYLQKYVINAVSNDDFFATLQINDL